MKPILLIAFLLLLISCSKNKQTPGQNTHSKSDSAYAAKLINDGFLKYADSAKKDSLVAQLNNNFNIYEEDNFRIVDIDAEELAEFSFDHFLPGLNSILEKRGLHLSVKKLNDDEQSNDILMNGDTLQLYRREDMDSNTFWETASGNFFRKLNEILKTAKLDEQFYLLYSGNDLHTLLLTEEQFSNYADYYKETPKEYVPIDHKSGDCYLN